MTATEAFQHISAYTDQYHQWPKKAWVNQATAEWLSMGKFQLLDAHTLKFGRQQLGVAEWFVDPTLTDEQIRLEPANEM